METPVKAIIISLICSAVALAVLSCNADRRINDLERRLSEVDSQEAVTVEEYQNVASRRVKSESE
jgi:flagellar motor switch protein FliG